MAEKKDIIYRFATLLKQILGDKLTKVILYGSYARGDYDDFYIASRDKAAEQIRTAEYVLEKIKEHLQFTSTTNGG